MALIVNHPNDLDERTRTIQPLITTDSRATAGWHHATCPV
jgi:hypothetical protein